MSQIDRRNFLKFAGTSFIAASLPTGVFAKQKTPLQKGSWPILQGMTDASMASFIVMHPATAAFAAVIEGPLSNQVQVTTVQKAVIPGQKTAISEIVATGLIPGHDYTLSLVLDSGKTIDQRIFQSLGSSRPGCRFAVVSCMNDSFTEKARTMWQTLSEERPEFVLFIGDSCYADKFITQPSETEFSRRYTETRSLLYWFYMPRLIPSMAMWDDHDYGWNNGNKTFPYSPFMRSLFRLFWGQQQNRIMTTTFGVGSRLEAFGQRFYLMDDRTFRDNHHQKLGRHWGQEQTDWLMADLQTQTTPSWILNGNQYFGGYLGEESFESHYLEDFKYVLSQLKNVKCPVAFISGDVHFSEIMRIEPKILGYETFEFTSSAMHTWSVPFQQLRRYNPRRITSTWRNNFMIFETDIRRGWKIRCESIAEGHGRIFIQDVGITR